jgi:hypothetical protein
LRGRTEIFDELFLNDPSQDWLNPIFTERVEKEFIILAKERWQRDDDKWILEGGWLDKPADIVTWMRCKYWKDKRSGISRKNRRQ